MSSKIVLSIIIPVYNVENYLKKCLETVLCHNSEIQYILVNDGSSDDSLAIAEEFRGTYKNLSIISQKNKGLSAARNLGIKNAKGEWLYFVDSDDYVDSNFVEDVYNFIKKNCEYNLISLPVIKTTSNSKKIIQNCSSILSKDEYIKLLILGKRQFGVWSCVFKKEIISKYNILFEEGKLFEDQYFVPVYLKYVKSIYHLSSKEVGFYYYRFRKNSITHSKIYKEKIEQKLKAELFRDDSLSQLTNNNKVKKLINTNMLTLLYRAYINFIKINSIKEARQIKKEYFQILVNKQLTFRWKETIKTILMFCPINVLKRI